MLTKDINTENKKLRQNLYEMTGMYNQLKDELNKVQFNQNQNQNSGRERSRPTSASNKDKKRKFEEDIDNLIKEKDKEIIKSTNENNKLNEEIKRLKEKLNNKSSHDQYSLMEQLQSANNNVKD